MFTIATPFLPTTCGLFNTGSSINRVPSSLSSLDETMENLETPHLVDQVPSLPDDDGDLFGVDLWPLDDVFPLVSGDLSDDFYEQFADLSNSNDNFMMLDSSSVTASEQTSRCDDILAAAATMIVTEVPQQISSSTAEVSRQTSSTVDLTAITGTTVSTGHGDYVEESSRKITSAVDVSLALTSDHNDYVAGSSRKIAQAGRAKSPKRDHHQERRKKNNEASRQSRLLRKRRYAEMEESTESLERENERLKVRVAKMEHATKEMREELIRRIAERKRGDGQGEVAKKNYHPYRRPQMTGEA